MPSNKSDIFVQLIRREARIKKVQRAVIFGAIFGFIVLLVLWSNHQL